MSKKTKRKYTDEFKEEAVKLISEQGYAATDAARNLGVDPALLSKWKRKIESQNSLGTMSLKEAQTELAKLRKENKQLKLEREILKKAAAFFARESN